MATQDSTPSTSNTTTHANITTYHCLCTQLSLATTQPLSTLPKRTLDASAIATAGDFASSSNPKPVLTLQALTPDAAATVLKLDDGFEKRYPVRCERCGLAAGYFLDASAFAGREGEVGPRRDVLYVLPGGLMTTEELREGRSMEAEVGKVGEVVG